MDKKFSKHTIFPSAVMSFILLGAGMTCLMNVNAETAIGSTPQAVKADAEHDQADIAKAFDFLPDIVATCEESQITAEEVINALPPRLVMFMNNGYEPGKDDLKQVARQTVMQLINEKLLLAEALRANFEPDYDAAEEEVMELQNKVGMEKFQAGIDHQGITRDELVNRLGKHMAVNRWVQETIMPAIEKTDEELLKIYQEHKSEMREPEKVHVSHILVKVEADANEETRREARQKIEEIAAKIKAGSDFGELAGQSSDCPSAQTNGDLGLITPTDTVKPFSDAAFALNKDEVSDIVETNFGYHIIKSHDKVAARSPSFDEVKENIRQQVIQEELNQRLSEILEEARQKADIKIMIP